MAREIFSEYTFDELEIQKDIKRSIQKLGFEQMTPIQAEAIPVLLKGRDVIGQAQTGTGKTAAFGIPILEKIDPDNKKLQAVILCPTRELAMQVANELRGFAFYMHGIKLLPVYGGQDIKKQIQGLKGTQIIVGTPGRVMDHMRRRTIKMNHVTMCVLDEADEMLKMGFREDMEVILGAIEHPHQTCLFSATMPKEILDLTDRFQCNPEYIKVAGKELTMERITQYYYAVKREYKTEALLRLMAFHQYHKSIVFCNTKSMTEELAEKLRKEGYQAQALHGDLSQKQRDTVMGQFRNGACNVLLATDIAARGLDVDDVEAVFNYDIPQETEFYVHRIGRTGRAGREGVSHTLCKSKEFSKIHEIEAICNSKMIESKIPSSTVINEAKIDNVLKKVVGIMGDGSSENYLSVIKEYCEKNDIEVLRLAAAFLKMELGELVEQLEIDLPDNERKRGKRGHNDRREKWNRGDGKKGGVPRERAGRQERYYSKKKEDRFEHSGKKHRDNRKKKEMKSDKKKNKKEGKKR